MKNVLLKTILAAVGLTLWWFPSFVWSQSVPLGPKVSSTYPIAEQLPEKRSLVERIPSSSNKPIPPLPDEGGLVGRLPPPLPEKPLPPQRELPPGIVVVPSYCPKGFEEIPNGLELYKVEPELIPWPGSPPQPAHLVVCRQVETATK